MIKLKTLQEIQIMREGGKISVLALKKVLEAVKSGVTLAQLDKIAEEIIIKNDAQASFKTVDNYKYTTCVNINEGIVHGIPNNYVIKRGDLVSVDLGALYKGFHTDVSYTVEAETYQEHKFLETGKQALELALEKCIVGNTIGDISNAIQKYVEITGYSVSRELVGHGIGRALHEDPYVACYGRKGRGIALQEGMVFAVEVIYQKGRPDLVLADDGWTLKTADNSLSALFEVTVAVGRDKPLILTEI